jgi:hypothetical protein
MSIRTLDILCHIAFYRGYAEVLLEVTGDNSHLFLTSFNEMPTVFKSTPIRNVMYILHIY